MTERVKDFEFDPNSDKDIGTQLLEWFQEAIKIVKRNTEDPDSDETAQDMEDLTWVYRFMPPDRGM